MGRRAGAVPAVVTTPSHRGEGWGGVCSVKTFTSLCAPCWAGKSSYRQGSVLEWSQPWTWIVRRMTICLHRQDKTTTMMDVLNVLLLLRFYFYSTLIINSVCYAYLCRCCYCNSAVMCIIPLDFLSVFWIKNLYTARRVSSVPQFHSSKMIDCYLDVIIYIIYIINLFSQSQRSVNNELWNCGTEDTLPPMLYLRYWN